MASDFNMSGGGGGPFAEWAIILALKALGAAAGTIMSLAIIMPETKLDAARRACVSMLAGIMFGWPVKRYFEWQGHEGEIAAAAVVAIVAWFVIGTVVRTTARWRTIDEVKHDLKPD
jgi:uncharacterized membrane protein